VRVDAHLRVDPVSEPLQRQVLVSKLEAFHISVLDRLARSNETLRPFVVICTRASNGERPVDSGIQPGSGIPPLLSPKKPVMFWSATV